MNATVLTELYRQQLSSDYLVHKEIGTGAYGVTYLARERHGQKREVVLKLPNLDIKRNIDDLTKRLEEFNHSLEAEHQGMRRLDAVRCVAHVLRPGKFEITLGSGNDCILVSYIVQECVHGKDFLPYLIGPSFRSCIKVRRPKPNKPGSVFGGITNPEKYLSLASAIVRAVAEVHKNEVVHGDLWPQNIMMRGGEPVIIDFGQSLLLDLVFLARGEPPISHEYAAPERRDPDRQWSTAADIYSLGGVLFFLATGDPPPDPIPDIEELKREVCRRMKERNRELYLANSGIADVIARCLRSNDRERPAFAEAVLEELNIFLAGPKRTPPKLDEAMRSLGGAIRHLRRNPNQAFTQIASARIRTLTWQFSEMSHGLYTLAGHPENITRGMVDLLSLMRKGDSYLTVSVPSFWGRSGLGVNGRFLEMNKIAAQNGASIGRVFLITPEEARLPEVRTILGAHRRIVEELKERSPKVSTNKSVAIARTKGYYTGVVLMEEWERNRLDFLNFGVWSKVKKSQDVLIVPAYREKGKDVAAIRFWAPSVDRKRIGVARKLAVDFIEKSIPIGEFLAHAFRQRRRCPRERGDERLIVEVQLKPNAKHAAFPSDTFSARVVDHCPRGISLKVGTSPKNGMPKKGDAMRLIGDTPLRTKWAKRLWGAHLKVKWIALAKESGIPAWTVGLST